MWQRFTEDAKRIIWRAQEEAKTLGSRKVGAQHLLFAMLRDEDNAALRVLARSGVQPSRVLARMEEESLGTGSRWDGETKMSASCKRAIDGAYDEARLMSSREIGPEHILMGLFRVRQRIIDKIVLRERHFTLAGRVLKELGLNLETARITAREIQSGSIPESNYPRPNRA
jgi:ATP-dependent Clp protease ATP-binding subunit ClpC